MFSVWNQACFGIITRYLKFKSLADLQIVSFEPNPNIPTIIVFKVSSHAFLSFH